MDIVLGAPSRDIVDYYTDILVYISFYLPAVYK